MRKKESGYKNEGARAQYPAAFSLFRARLDYEFTRYASAATVWDATNALTEMARLLDDFKGETAAVVKNSVPTPRANGGQDDF